MQTAPSEFPQSGLREVDALAGVTHKWMRQQLMEHRFLGHILTGQDENALAAGFLAGLKALLTLNDGESMLIAYSYLLKRGSGQAVDLAGELVTGVEGFSVAESGYRTGRMAAEELLCDSATPTG